MDTFEERLAQLDALLEKEGLNPDALKRGSRIPARASGQTSPMSAAQRSIFLAQQLAPGDPSYNMTMTVPLPPSLDVGALAKAIDAVVRKHEILRTSFATSFEQQVSLEVTVPLRQVDAADMSDRLAIQRADAALPFDLSQGPPIRASLVRHREGHDLLLSVHHVACDGASLAYLFDDLSVAYESLRNGVDVELPAPEVQYADFAAWESEQLETDLGRQHLEWWRTKLAGANSLEFSDAAAHPPPSSGASGWELRVLSVPVTRDLHRYAGTSGTTLFAVLAAVFQATVARISGARDIVLSTAASHRERPELERAVGVYLNTVAVRTRLEDDPPLSEIVGRVRTASAEAFAHQGVPFESVVAAVAPLRQDGEIPFCQLMLAFHDFHPARFHSSQWEEPWGTVQFIQNATAKFPVALFVTEREGRLELALEYDSRKLTAAHSGVLLDSVVGTIDALLSDPSIRLSQLRLVSDAEGMIQVQAERPRRRPVPPRDEVEVQVLSIWKTLLGRDDIGVEDGFFEVGGKSVLLFRMKALLEEAFGRPVEVSDLFRYPRVRAIAELLGVKSNEAAPVDEAEERGRARSAAAGRRRKGAGGE